MTAQELAAQHEADNYGHSATAYRCTELTGGCGCGRWIYVCRTCAWELPGRG